MLNWWWVCLYPPWFLTARSKIYYSITIRSFLHTREASWITWFLLQRSAYCLLPVPHNSIYTRQLTPHSWRRHITLLKDVYKHCKYIEIKISTITEGKTTRNQTLSSCNPTLFQMSVSFDNYYWEDDNITDVCDGNCTLQARDWDLSVSLACSDRENSRQHSIVKSQTFFWEWYWFNGRMDQRLRKTHSCRFDIGSIRRRAEHCVLGVHVSDSLLIL